MQSIPSRQVSVVSGELPPRGANTAEILMNDHEIIKGLLQQLTQATQRTQRMETLEQLKAVLTIHNATEENLVYPALAKIAGKKSESEHLYHETALADMLLFELDTMLKEGKEADFAPTAEKLQSAILEHVDDEESKALPHLEKHARPEQAALLTESVRKFRSSLRFEAAAK